MSNIHIKESDLERLALSWFDSMDYAILYGPDILPGEHSLEREDIKEAILPRRLRQAIEGLNPSIPADAIENAYRKITRAEYPSLIANNRVFHKMLIDGIPVEYRRKDGSIAWDNARLIDFDNPGNNDWLAVNQYTVQEGQITRRADIVIFVNGLPVGIIELKNPADEKATIEAAYNQIQTYKEQVSALFTHNELVVISDGLSARVGSLTSGKERFMRWRTIDGLDTAPEKRLLELEVLLKGLFNKRQILEMLRHFIVFEDGADGVAEKKLAGYHQVHAVKHAVEATERAAGPAGDKRCGVVWHTQGSGKSLTMVFYAGKLALNPLLSNPTILIITDRNDLDGQLFGTFARCHELLRQKPVQAGSRASLRELLKVASGGIIFTTVQKFFPVDTEDSHPLLSERRNIVVIADEAHRSQYDFIDGYARHMRDALPGASFIGFTGTPIELSDKNTRAVFGEHVSIYDIRQSVADKATVPIYYESRLAKLELREEERPKIDPQIDEVTEGEELIHIEKLKTKWAALEALVGTEKRIAQIAADLVEHFEKRLQAMDGKAMVVCMSRRICVELYNAITMLRPKWHGEDDSTGEIKIVMTGKGADPLQWQRHIRNKSSHEELANRYKNPEDPFKIVIVMNMWLTGFDAPCLHTMYVDKPLKGHALMQAIARVNRIFKDKPGGLVVDYLGLADNLKHALMTYTENGGTGKAAIDKEEAVAVMLEKYEICCDMFHNFNWLLWRSGTKEQKLAILPSAQEHILQQQEGKARFIDTVTKLSRAFALSVPHERALGIIDDVAFFQTVRSALAKTTENDRESDSAGRDLDHAIRRIVSTAVVSEGIVDIFAAAGLNNRDISILSDEFLAEIQGLPQKNLAVELLQRLLSDKIRAFAKKNIVLGRSFAEMLERSIRKYHNRAIETAKIIEELIALAKYMNKAANRSEKMKLTEDEFAFYDALETNDSAVKVLGDEVLRTIARELVDTIKNNWAIDWTLRENVRAKLRLHVKRVLKKYGYPPDKQEKAANTVIEQAELLCADMAD
ncbi:MAG: type I restriction endonuclease subunit R [Nitrospirae bacterium]|nr:type I restriction endonuclease subunit R [Nitrospirota bacterium]